jgi:hypothetical protein
MATSFQKYKDAESALQERVAPLEYKVTIEPISGTDIFYSDGTVALSYGKASFTNKNQFEFNVFFPDLYCFFSIPALLKKELEEWLEELK